LLGEALAADIPVFAICRGLQLFNVACGGTLVQHLDSTKVHRQKPKDAEPGMHPPAHRVWVAPDTRLAKIVGGGGIDVNSRHHQAIESLGQDLIVSAISEDGVIEAIEKPGAAFALAVQWHPEDRVLVSETDRKLFAAFAAAMVSPR
jgi:putative glutamine amidotransferase